MLGLLHWLSAGSGSICKKGGLTLDGLGGEEIMNRILHPFCDQSCLYIFFQVLKNDTARQVGEFLLQGQALMPYPTANVYKDRCRWLQTIAQLLFEWEYLEPRSLPFMKSCHPCGKPSEILGMVLQPGEWLFISVVCKVPSGVSRIRGVLILGLTQEPWKSRKALRHELETVALSASEVRCLL